jgi:hypothetical protein
MTSRPKRSKPIIDKQVMPKRQLDDYLGLYENPAYGQLEIFILDEENSTNKLIAEYGYVDLILYPKSRRDEFFFETSCSVVVGPVGFDGGLSTFLNIGGSFGSKLGILSLSINPFCDLNCTVPKLISFAAIPSGQVMMKILCSAIVFTNI